MPATVTPREAFPRLIVQDVDAAIAFYRAVFGAELMARFAEPDGLVGFAKLALGDFRLSLSEEKPEWGWNSPKSLGGSPVLIQLELPDCDTVAERMIAEKAVVVIPKSRTALTESGKAAFATPSDIFGSSARR